jgi:two-component system sensor histidine kinase/response regulator
MKPNAAANQPTAAEPAVEKTKQALCVDSEEKTCPVMSALLSELGYTLSHCTSLEEGLHLIRTRHFDLLLLDWQLKDGTGVELCRMVRTFDAQTPILFYSASAGESEKQRAMGAGAQGYLVRPVEVVNLLQIISHYTATDHPPVSGPPSGT